MPPKAVKKGVKGKPGAKPAGKAGSSTKASEPPPGTSAPAAAAAPAPEPMGEKVTVKMFQKFCFESPENVLAKSGRWPLISDESERATTFLRYRDVNILNVMSASDVSSERIRLAIIGALRYGKPVVFDLTETDVNATWPELVKAVNALKPDLMDSILDKTILKEDYYMTLVKDSDGDEYGKYMFNPDSLKNFSFVLTSAKTTFPPEVLQKFFVVTIE